MAGLYGRSHHNICEGGDITRLGFGEIAAWARRSSFNWVDATPKWRTLCEGAIVGAGMGASLPYGCTDADTKMDLGAGIATGILGVDIDSPSFVIGGIGDSSILERLASRHKTWGVYSGGGAARGIRSARFPALLRMRPNQEGVISNTRGGALPTRAPVGIESQFPTRSPGLRRYRSFGPVFFLYDADLREAHRPDTSESPIWPMM